MNPHNSQPERRRRLGLVQIEKQDIDRLADEFTEEHIRFWTLATLEAFMRNPAYYRRLAASRKRAVNKYGRPLVLIHTRFGPCKIELPTRYNMN